MSWYWPYTKENHIINTKSENSTGIEEVQSSMGEKHVLNKMGSDPFYRHWGNVGFIAPIV